MFAYLLKESSPNKSIIFYRDFQEYTGGHQKVADYFQHVKSTSKYDSGISFSAATRWDSSNPWFPEYQQKQVDYLPINYDYAFLAGVDWQLYLSTPRPKNQPVINLIQHVRHADPAQPMYRFLVEKAVRICVSTDVASAIQSTGKVNGPLFTIANGIEIPAIEPQQKKHDLLIFGPKNPKMAAELKNNLALQGIHAFCISDWLPRQELLTLLASSRIAVMLPNETEGFYLPALESMRFSELTIVPDCVGNRSFCRNRKNCLFPEYNSAALMDAVKEAMEIIGQPAQLNTFKQHCESTLAYHSLARERDEFLKLMQQLDTLWQQM